MRKGFEEIMATRSTVLAFLALAAVGCEAHVELPGPHLNIAGRTAPTPPVPPSPGPDAGPPPTPPSPQKLATPTFESYEAKSDSKLILRGTAEPGAEVAVHYLGTDCDYELATTTASESGDFIITVDDIRLNGYAGFEAQAWLGKRASACQTYPDFFETTVELDPAPAKATELTLTLPSSTGMTLAFKASEDLDRVLVFNHSDQCEGEPLLSKEQPVMTDGRYVFRMFHIPEPLKVRLTVATEKNGKRSACSDAIEHEMEAPPPAPTWQMRVDAFTPVPNGIYLFQANGSAPYPDDVKFFDQPDCSGNDITRHMTKYQSDGFNAWIDVPPNTYLSTLGFQVTHEGEPHCQAVPVDISTFDDDILHIDPIARARRDDASIGVTLTGTVRGATVEVFLGEECSGTPVASADASTSLPYDWSLAFEWHEWLSHVVAFRIAGSHFQERCIVKGDFIGLPYAEIGTLPDPVGRLQTDMGNSLEFYFGFENRPSDANYYVNISYESDCSNPIFRGAPKADYLVTLPAPVAAIYGYTVSEDYQRAGCVKLY
jgi:hypothetical protein